MSSTHYSIAQYPDMMADFATQKSQVLRNIFKKPEFKNLIPILCYSGMSGVSHATALALALQKKKFVFGMAYVRKEKEKSHGQQVEWNFPERKNKKYILVFVDDFISSGATFRYTVSNCLSKVKAIMVKCEVIRIFNTGVADLIRTKDESGWESNNYWNAERFS